MEKKPILVVDDEKNIRLTMSQSLESLEIPIKTAVNGEEALRKLQEGPFGLVFLDLKMPGIDGIEVLRQIKDDWPKIRVIIITAHGTIESAVEAMKLGAVDFIQKPFSPGEIRELATQVLEREALDEESAVDYFSLIEILNPLSVNFGMGAVIQVLVNVLNQIAAFFAGIGKSFTILNNSSVLTSIVLLSISALFICELSFRKFR